MVDFGLNTAAFDAPGWRGARRTFKAGQIIERMNQIVRRPRSSLLKIGICGDVTGSGYYRASLVKRYIEKTQSDVDVFLTHIPTIDFLECDVAYFVIPAPHTAMIEFVEGLKKNNVAIVIDVDDDNFNVPTWNPQHAKFSDPSVISYYERLYALADVITTPSCYLAERLRKHTSGKIVVIENAFDTNLKILRPQDPQSSDSIACVGWAGGNQHGADLDAIKNILEECVNRKMGLQFFGAAPKLSFAQLCSAQTISWVESPEIYFQLLALARFDVLLIPLVAEPFNMSKSALKCVEFLHFTGAPIVVSDLPPYDVISIGPRVTKIKGFDTEEWMAAIEKSIAVMRTQGRSYSLDKKYTMDATILKWMEVFRAAAI